MFWYLWIFFMFSTPLVLVNMIAYGFYINSFDKIVAIELATATGLLSKFTWISEKIDIFKDWVYLYSLYHSVGNFIILLLSIIIPFAIVDFFGSNSGGTNLVYNFTVYIGITFSNLERVGRLGSNMLI